MAFHATFRGIAKDGIVTFDDPSEWRRQVRCFEGKTVEVLIREPKKWRSDSQRKYYFAVIVRMLSEHTGYEEGEMHDALRWKFLQKHDAPIPTVRSTNDLDTAEAERYYEDCRRFAAEMGLVVPLPNEVEFE